MNAAAKRRKWLLILYLFVGGIAMLVLIFFWMYPSWKTTKGFEEPKIVTVRVDEEPFMRVTLGPGERYRPIEVMAGTLVDAYCEVVATSEPLRFLLKGFGQTFETTDCRFRIQVPEQPGLSENLSFLFFNGTVSEPTDQVEVPVVVVAAGERFEFHALEDEHGNLIEGVSVPDRIRVYARAITHLPDPKQFVALFFVSDPTSGRPVIALDTKDPSNPRPMLSNLVKYRKYGQALEGYAVWTPDPIQVGTSGDSRTVTDIYFGIFKRDSVPAVLEKVVSIERKSDDSLVLTPLLSDVESLKALTWNRAALSPPLHVVRGAQPVDIRSAKQN